MSQRNAIKVRPAIHLSGPLDRKRGYMLWVPGYPVDPIPVPWKAGLTGGESESDLQNLADTRSWRALGGWHPYYLRLYSSGYGFKRNGQNQYFS